MLDFFNASLTKGLTICRCARLEIQVQLHRILYENPEKQLNWQLSSSPFITATEVSSQELSIPKTIIFFQKLKSS